MYLFVCMCVCVSACACVCLCMDVCLQMCMLVIVHVIICIIHIHPQSFRLAQGEVSGGACGVSTHLLNFKMASSTAYTRTDDKLICNFELVLKAGPAGIIHADGKDTRCIPIERNLLTMHGVLITQLRALQPLLFFTRPQIRRCLHHAVYEV